MKQCKKLMRNYKSQPEREKETTKALCAMLNGFHFEVTEAQQEEIH